MATKSRKKSTKSIEQTYQKKEQREHILLRPDSYVGSTKRVTEEMWVFNSESGKMERKIVEFSWALLNIFDELIVNAMDHATKESSVKKIKINIDQKTNTISVWNNGPGIPVIEHSEHKMYIPELIFGQLLSGSNFDDSEERFTGGRNGYGAKLTNIYSTQFSIETVDSQRGLKYKQTWNDNMSVRGEPKVTKFKGTSFTCITFSPDLKRFGKMKRLDSDIVSLFEKRCYDACACTRKDLVVELNGTVLKIKQFAAAGSAKSYLDLYIGPKSETKRVTIAKEMKNGMIWELGVCMNPNPDDKFQQVSFVNGICTEKGGKHTDYITNQLIKQLIEHIKSKSKSNKELNVRWSYIKDRLFVFLRTTIVNPAFSSQTKEELTTPSKDFGFTFDIKKLDPKFVDKVGKLGIVDEVISFAKFKENRELAKKTDGKKRNKIYGIPKLDDANLAGTTNSKKCTLILTEGDSAKAFAMEGLSVIGRDHYGVFPLRGKLLNVREATANKLTTNEEIANLKQILGLQQDKKYKDTAALRYGSILILTDQDVDGSHIKGLLINLFHSWWPELLGVKGFIKTLATPIVKVTKGNQVKAFFTMTEYENWRRSPESRGNWKTKYYKGLGTSDRKEARECFTGLTRKEISFLSDATTDASIRLAFEKKQADNRKEWLGGYDKARILEQDNKTPTFTDFITKDLVHFSVYDNERSIPSVCDGLKPSQRKVLFGCFKRNLVDEIKVAQLAGYISEHAAYHHGEMSLNETIIKMAQNYVGSNNVNLLVPSGQFGTRYLGGKDAASPRYIYTYLEPITKKLFHPDDQALLKYLKDDGKPIEPEWYLPILPMVLINGTSGIGTGYSTDVPCYHPRDIITNVLRKMEGEQLIDMKPWYRGFKGTIEPNGRAGSWVTKGVWERTGDFKVTITELPIGTWITNYKQFLEELCGVNVTTSKTKETKKKKKDSPLESFEEQHKGQQVKFVLEFANKESLDKLLKNVDKFEKEFKLTTHLSTTNMHLFNAKKQIRKYATPNDILLEFCELRETYYTKRREYLLEQLNRELNQIAAKVKFIEDIIESRILVFRKPKREVEKQLTENEYPKFDGSYSYLTSMPIHSFTEERIAELKEKRDNIQVELDELEAKTGNDLWSEDLVDYLGEFDKHQDSWEKDLLEAGTESAVVSKRKVIKKKKLKR